MLAFLQPLREALNASPESLRVASGVLLAALVGAVVLSAATRKPSPGKRLKQPKSTLPLLGNALDMVRNNDVIHDWFWSLVKEFDGEPFVLKLPSRPDLVIISTPEAFEDVTKTQYDNFGKGPFQYEFFHDLMGTALTLVDGERWRYQRKIFANVLSAQQLREVMQPILIKYTETLASIFVNAADNHEPFDMFRILNRFTMESFAEIAFGIQMGSLASGKPHPLETSFNLAQELSARRFVLPVWYWKLERWLCVGPERQLKEAIDVVRGTAMDFIKQSIDKRNRGEIGDAKNIVSLVLDSLDASEAVDVEMLRSIVIVALAAGRDTTSQTMSWFVHLVTQNPRVEEKIREEVRAKIPTLAKDDTYVPTMEDVQDLIYVEACLKEVLRLYPPVAFNMRHSSEDTYLSDGTFIPAGTDVGIPHYSMGRRSAIWGEDCDEFKPERFIDAETGKLLYMSPYKFNFFHAGPRICLGINLAMMEMKMVIASLYSRYHVVAVPGQTITYARSTTLSMRDPFMVHLDRV